MKQNNDDYQVVPYPKDRRAAAVLYRSVQRKPMIHGLIEVDVTRARAFLREHKAKTGESLSFTAFIATCLGKAVDENKSVQAYRKGRKHLILFDDVDVTTRIERDVPGQRQIINYTIRAANRKTFREIHHEIRAAQHEEIRAAQADPVSGREGKASTWVTLLPSFVQQMFFWVGSKSPHLLTQNIGTVELNAIGMFGSRGGWGIHQQYEAQAAHLAAH